MKRTNKTLKEQAFEAIRANVVSGSWPGGTFLSEKSLSEQLQMSKTPIRSALDRLEMMGLVKLSPNQGVIVQEISLKKILDIYELRLALETYAAQKLTGKLDDAFFRRLDDNLQLQAETIEQEAIQRYVLLDCEFHAMIVAALDNEEYIEAMARIQDRLLMSVRSTFMKNHQRLWTSRDEHVCIRQALQGNDAKETTRLMQQHIEFVKTVML